MDYTSLCVNYDYVCSIRLDQSKYKKVCFDLSQLKKKEKIYTEFNIPLSEQIVAFCKWGVLMPITFGGIIFTDVAAYFYPRSETPIGEKIGRLPYADLCSYLLIQEGAKGKVYALSEKNEIRLSDEKLISQNIAGSEIKQILERVQRQVLQNVPASKALLDKLASSLTQKVKDDMGVSPLSCRNEAILNSLMAFPDYAEAAALVKAEYLFREFRPEKYAAFADNLPTYVFPDVKHQIKSIPDAFYKNYIRTLTDINREFLYKDLSTVYDRIDGEDKTSYIYRACISIRMYEHERTERCISAVRRNFGDKDANVLEWFRCTYYYHEMMNVYEAIKNQKDLPSTFWRSRDGIGLTPLHYAIILKDEKAITFLLEQKEWTTATPYWKLESATRMYEYLVPACGKQLPQLDALVHRTNKDAISCKNAIKNISHRLTLQGVIREAQDCSMFGQKWNYVNKQVHHASKEELRNLSSQMEKLKQSMEQAQNNADELYEMLSEYEQMLGLIVEESISKALEILEDAKNSTDPITNYLLRIYFEPDFFEKVLLAVKEKRGLNLYNHKGFYFIAPDFAEIDLPVLDRMGHAQASEQETKTTIPPDRPSYGNSWFSRAAHQNAENLKAEYRILAKLYHPDVSQHPKSNDLFQKISAEYKEILSDLA